MKNLILIILLSSCFKSYKIKNIAFKDRKGFIQAICDRDLNTVKKWISKGIDLEQNYLHNGYMGTPILFAANSGHLEIFKMILKADKNPDLDSALENASNSGSIEIVKEILKYSKNPNLDKALCLASSKEKDELVKYLIKEGANINYVSNKDEEDVRLYPISNPLTETIRNNHLSTFIELLGLGADPNIKTYLNSTPLMYVCYLDNSEHKETRLKMLKELIRRGVSLIAKSDKGNNIMHFAALTGFTEAIDLLIMLGVEVNVRNIYGFTPLSLASKVGQLDTVKILLEKGAESNNITNCGNNALTLVCVKDPSFGIDEISPRRIITIYNHDDEESIKDRIARVAIIEELIKYKADFNKKVTHNYGKGKNALMISYNQNFLKASKTLILGGADIKEFVKYALKQIIHKKDKKILRILFKYSSDTPEVLKSNLKLLELKDKNRSEILLGLIKEIIKDEKHNILAERFENFLENYN